MYVAGCILRGWHSLPDGGSGLTWEREDLDEAIRLFQLCLSWSGTFILRRHGSITLPPG
jgi:hypothetical protein